MPQPPDPGRDTGPEPGRDPGLPGGASVADAGRAERLGLFASGKAGDRFAPGSWLAMLADELSGPDRRCPGATDDALVGLLGRWQALESWAAAGKLGVVAELARRRARPGHQNRRPAGLPDAWQEGTGHEVAAALGMSLPGADDLLALAVGLQAQLPRIYALLAAGTIGYVHAKVIADELAVLADRLAAQAEALIVGEVAGKTPGQVRRLAAAAVVAVDPRGAEKRREAAERECARVRFWREAAGTAALAAYGLPTDAALAANANIAARARQYKAARLMGTMDQLRVQAYLDMLNGVAAHDRIARARAGEQAARARAGAGAYAGGGAQAGQPGGPGGSGGGSAGDRRSGDELGDDQPADDAPGDGRPADDLPADDRQGDDRPEADDPQGDDERWDWGPPEDGPGYLWLGNDGPWDDDDDPDADGTGDDQPPDSDAGDDLPDDGDGGNGGGPGRGAGPGGPGRGPGAGPHDDDPGPELAASINLTLPLVTLQRLADRPGHGHGLGPLDPALARDLAAAARSPHSTWCLTITSPQGYAIGHGCARPARHKRGKAPPGSRAGPWSLTRNHDDPGPVGGWGTWTLALPGGRDYTIRLGPIPVTGCDHRYESRGYQPGGTLRHLVQVRDGECTFPPCSRHARDCDFEHAVPYDQGGRTCGCNAGARSRRTHRVKQSKNWTVSQPLPGWHQWTTPSGRTYTQAPKKHPA